MTTQNTVKTQTKPSIANAVQDMYTGVATAPPPDLHFPVGRKAAIFVGYSEEELDSIPEAAVESFAGVGHPFQGDAIEKGHTVLDIGSGSGTDLLLAARLIGPTGRAFGLDFTDAMIKKALRNIDESGAHQAFILHADAGDRIPLPDNSVDVITSNGVINLIPDKARAFAEMHRVLKPGGRLQIADIVVNEAIPESARSDSTLWAACIAGADLSDIYLQTVKAAGFQEVEVMHHFDYFAGAPREDSRKTASKFKAEAIVYTAQKAKA
jgi:arsenite methyltransferase